MKKIKILYWVFTVLFAVMMLLSAIPNILVTAESVAMVTNVLGYPKYLIAFLGVAKAVGAITILIPGIPRLKEWAYAGLFFDLIGATYSILATAQPGAWFMIVPIGVGILSYIFYSRYRRQLRSKNELTNGQQLAQSLPTEMSF